VERQLVTDVQGRTWYVGLMDIFGQEGDPDMPNEWLELQAASGRYFTLIYSASGAIQWERGHSSLQEATEMYNQLVTSVSEGRLNPAQPVFRATFDD
jgi:hypothetical protein